MALTYTQNLMGGDLQRPIREHVFIGSLVFACELVASVKQTVTVWVAEAQSTGRRATRWFAGRSR